MTTKKTIVQTSQAPPAIGPFSQAVGFGGMLFLSGQTGVDPHLGHLVEGGVASQMRQVMKNIRAVLLASGLDLEHIVSASVYLKNMSDYRSINTVYGEFFDNNPPARTVVEVSRLPEDALVAVDAIAAVPQAPTPVTPDAAVVAAAAASAPADDSEGDGPDGGAATTAPDPEEEASAGEEE